MKDVKKSRTSQILMVMHILAWVAYIGFLIDGGGLFFTFVHSCFNHEVAKNLYRGLNLFSLSEFNFFYYVSTISFMVTIIFLKATVCFLVIQTLSKFKLKNPFTQEVVHKLETISYVLFGTWVITMLGNAYTAWLLKRTGELYGSWVSGEFIFTAGLVFVISQIFKRGVEIQSENELTV